MKRALLYLFLILPGYILEAGSTEKYSVLELVFQGPSSGNPFTDVQISAEFTIMNRTLFCEGFYDGEDTYRIRFMPDTEGQSSYVTNRF